MSNFAPTQFKTYILQSPKCEWPLTLCELYDVQKDAKVIDLVDLGEKPRRVWLAMSLSIKEEGTLVNIQLKRVLVCVCMDL